MTEVKADRKTEFLTKLKDLLTEYGASIDVGYSDCSDLQGVWGEHMQILMVKENARSAWDTEEVLRVNGWGISPSDL